MKYIDIPKHEIETQLSGLIKEYGRYMGMGLKLDMSRGKPCPEQLDLSKMLLIDETGYKAKNGFDCRNYGVLDGIEEAKSFFAGIMDVPTGNVIVGGNSSLNMMFDIIAQGMSKGFGEGAWAKEDKIKFLCPAPGYDRHFAITEYFGFEMINIPMQADGPDMDMIEESIKDPAVKGIWCVPKYSNPEGTTYSDEVVKRMSALKPAAKDFIIMYDNAYAVHHLNDTPDTLLNIFDECKKNGTEDMLLQFASTSKITFAGSGMSAVAASDNTIKKLKARLTLQTIGSDKINQLRHCRMFNSPEALMKHMAEHAKIIAPKFEVVLSKLEAQLAPLDIARWTKPNGGYFVSFYAQKGCASRIATLCKDAGMVLTPAGASYPYGVDPDDSNIRIAPTFPPLTELDVAMDLFCLAVKIATLEKMKEGQNT